MIFPSDLTYGTLIKRYKRFLADVKFDTGEELTVHCPNPGAMMGITTPGSRVALSKAVNVARKLAYTWEMVESEGTWIGTNTNNPNLIVAEALAKKSIPELADYKNVKAEVKYGQNSRIDFFLTDGPTEMCLVEVKNVHLIRNNHMAEFPDCITARGAKHQLELANQVKSGIRSIVLYVVQRDDALTFKVADDLDKAYGEASRQATKAGVETLAYCCNMLPTGITLKQPLQVLG
ncbi:MAG: DNA/RNA nuclease SfsA [Pseudomonadota bacterium]|jgi:sugar fermentation stimulation protein A|nr:DNA/RNA nuclease SfsA [Alphaproteobacteria bacterium]